MRMLNMKRFIIILLVSLSLIFTAVGSSVYFLNVNDYSLWISKQIKKSTGYDVRFESFENNWLTDHSLSLTGLSLYQQQQRVLHINRLELKIDKLDLWQRELAIKSINLQGVYVDFNSPFIAQKAKLTGEEGTQKQVDDLNNIAWERLHIANVQVSDLHVNVQYNDQTLLLNDANIELNNVLVIDKKQLQILPKNIDSTLQFNSLKFTNATQKTQLNNVKLSAKGNLFARQAKVELSADVIDMVINGVTKEPLPLLFESLQLSLQLKQNKLSLVNFFVNAFSGSLSASADMLFAIKLLPKPAVKLQQLTLNRLTAKNMKLVIPDLLPTNGQAPSNQKDEALPAEAFLIKNIRLQNIDIDSVTQQLPLTVKSANLELNNFYIVKDYKLLDITQLTQEAGGFDFSVARLRWQGMLLEQFSMAGSLSENDQGLQTLKQLLSE